MKSPLHFVPRTFDEASDFMNWHLGSNENYYRALRTVLNNSSGRVWLIGGSVYRTLLFGDCDQAKDFDFIAEEIGEDCDVVLGDCQSFRRNRFGGLKFGFYEGGLDLMQLSNIYHIRERGIDATIENYLGGVPFNFQSIAYEVLNEGGKVVGEVGLEAIREGVLRVNDFEMADAMARSYSSSVSEIALKKSMELDLEYKGA